MKWEDYGFDEDGNRFPLTAGHGESINIIFTDGFELNDVDIPGGGDIQALARASLNTIVMNSGVPDHVGAHEVGHIFTLDHAMGPGTANKLMRASATGTEIDFYEVMTINTAIEDEWMNKTEASYFYDLFFDGRISHRQYRDLLQTLGGQ